MSITSFCLGLLLTVGATGLSAAVAFMGFHNAYYMAPLLPAFMALYVLIAWLMHLRVGGLGRTTMQLKDTIRHPETRLAGDLPDDTVTGAQVSDLRDENGLIRRRPLPGEPEGGTERAVKSTTSALLWSALQLAVLATVLYHFFGIGATYFQP
ncbi:MAG: hypothetical protein ACM3WU_00865 [Bacillota bacterium]